jgi:uncharacterized protein
MGIEMQKQNRLPVAFAAYVGWVLITVVGGRLMNGGAEATLMDTIGKGVSWNILAAIIFLLVLTRFVNWHDFKFVKPQPWSSLKLLWLPALYLIAFFTMCLMLGLPSWAVVAFFFINTVFVGISEEFMFRGVMFEGLRSKLATWPSIILTTLLFGSVHILNVFITGKLGEAAIQSVAASMSGLVFIALLIRTQSIWVPIVYHSLWDFGTFLMGSAASPGEEPSTGVMVLFPILLVLPNFLYALYLLRKVRNDGGLPGELAPRPVG